MRQDDFFSLAREYMAWKEEELLDLYKRCVSPDVFEAPDYLTPGQTNIMKRIHGYCQYSTLELQLICEGKLGMFINTRKKAIRALVHEEFPPLRNLFSIIPFEPFALIRDRYNREKRDKIHKELLPMILKYERMDLSSLREEYFELTGDITFLLSRTHLITYLCVLRFNEDLDIAGIQEKIRIQDKIRREEPLAQFQEEFQKALAKKPIREISSVVETLEDLIRLGEQFDPHYDYHFDMKRLNDILPVLKKLQNFIGLSKVKEQVVEQLLYFLQFEKKLEFMHTVLTGPPGVGKTEFAKLLGELYLAMGILKKKVFKKVVRSDLIAGFSGQTALKTRDAVRAAIGGVLFIDEVYALGNEFQGNGHGNFSKECIDTLNELLSEERDNFICIVAGYKEEIEKCFFSYNQGLKSRFPIRFDLQPYNVNELFQIFCLKVEAIQWKIEEDLQSTCFEKDVLINGRDVENFLSLVKRCHSKRVFTLSKDQKKVITRNDIERAFSIMKNMAEKPEPDISHLFMYI